MEAINNQPVTIRVTDQDNVSIVLNPEGLPSGTRLEDGTILLEHVPPGHKIALTDLEEDTPLIRYGEL
jgi:galactarate dehydratase